MPELRPLAEFKHAPPGAPAAEPVPWLFVTRVPEGAAEPNCCARFVGVTERFWFDARERACNLLNVAREHVEWWRLDGAL